jgi:hypothetical protein
MKGTINDPIFMKLDNKKAIENYSQYTMTLKAAIWVHVNIIQA